MKNAISLATWLAVALALASPAAAQEWAVERLEASPRHHEWVEVPAGQGRTVRSFVAYPESSEGALAVIVLHENRGLTDWVRSFADQLAAAGYLAIAPDLLSGFSGERAHTGAFPTSDAAREAIYQLDADRVTSDLLAVEKYVASRPGASGKTAVVGFCWGGAQAFRFATSSPEVDAALVFYGSPPEDAERIAAIRAPVFGFYGENDERINATIEPTRERMAAAGKTYEAVVYEGAGHAFMRQADDPEGPEAAKKAKEAAWKRLVEVLEAAE
ncbi:MAG TPA: dienelactone hydrolase family protein [Thermoanaerobaculia bacterium]|nr:dienelactone hydrolase family protein [Thermoanaerobaculia bacterium]